MLSLNQGLGQNNLLGLTICFLLLVLKFTGFFLLYNMILVIHIKILVHTQIILVLLKYLTCTVRIQTNLKMFMTKIIIFFLPWISGFSDQI